MDFLDPKKQRMHKVQLIVGYVLIGVALAMATTILLYEAYGFGIDKNGKIIQNGLVFLSTQPSSANIYVNGLPAKSQTNTRLQLPAGLYTVKLERNGYRTWQREISVQGGDVQHFDYPFLFPTQLITTAVKQYAAAPALVSQTPDRHWAMVQGAADFDSFDVYDLTKPKTAPTAFALPKGVMSDTDGMQSWQEVSWSADNQHLLLKHLYQKSGQAQSEYIMLDRSDAAQSFNLTKSLGVNPDSVALRDDAYDQYWLYDQPKATLSTATLKSPTPVLYLDHVLGFKPYGANMVLYATDQSATAGKVSIKLRQDDTTYTIRELQPSPAPYLIDMAQYAGNWYVLTGSSVENKVYVYKNPVSEIQGQPSTAPAPIRVLRLTNPSYASFSMNTQYIVAESGTNFGVYDVFNERQYAYTIKTPMDAPQAHAIWMDGARLMYVGASKLVAFDYDGTNQQTLEDALPQYMPFFDRDYKYSYSVTTLPVAATATKPATVVTQLDDTPMLIPQGQ